MTVYHYCSMDVFHKIISNKSIRLSDITKSNDSMEILWITKFIEEVFYEEFSKEIEKTKYFKDGFPEKVFRELVEHYSNDFFDEKQRIYSYFVCCFSENGDLLSQWRGYADDGNGVSIGFNTETLKAIGMPKKGDLISSNVFELNRMNYSELSQKASIRKAAISLIKELKIISKKSITNLKQESMKAYNKCFLELFKMSIFMKNPFFKEEKEWRMCHWSNTNSSDDTSNIKLDNGFALSNIDYHFRRNDMVPHIDLLFDGYKKSLIDKIIIGPKSCVRKNDIESFLIKNRINCSVEKTKGTYR